MLCSKSTRTGWPPTRGKAPGRLRLQPGPLHRKPPSKATSAARHLGQVREDTMLPRVRTLMGRRTRGTRGRELCSAEHDGAVPSFLRGRSASSLRWSFQRYGDFPLVEGGARTAASEL